MGQLFPPRTAETIERDQKLRELIQAAQARYDALSPLEKEMHDWAQRISWVYGEMGLEDELRGRTREDVARQLLTSNVGADYAARMLADQNFRRIARIEENFSK